MKNYLLISVGLLFITIGHSFGQASLEATFKFENNYSDDSGNGWTAKDSISTGTKSSFTFMNDTERGYVANFADNTTALCIPDHEGWLGATPRSISAWVNTTTPFVTIVSMGKKASKSKFVFAITATSALRLEIEGGGIETGSTSVTDGSWHHVALVWSNTDVNSDGSTNLTDGEVYLDGTKVAWAGSHTAVPNTVAGTTCIGLDVLTSAGTYRAFVGQMDDVMLIDGGLTSTEVANLYQEGLPTAIQEDDLMADINIITQNKTVVIQNNSDRCVIEFYNLGGILVKRCDLTSGSTTINLDKSGLYLLCIRKGSMVSTRKVLITD